MTSALATQINFYLKKAMEINLQIGGKQAYGCISKNKDKFLSMKESIQKGFHYIKEKLNEKEKKSVRAEHIRIDHEIQNKIADIEDQLEKMNNYLRKHAKVATQKNNQTYKLLYAQMMNFKDIISGNISSDRMPLNYNGQNVINFSDLRSGLLQPSPVENQRNKKEKHSTRIKKSIQMTDFQKNSKSKFDQKDKQINDLVDGVINKVDQLKIKANLMGQAIDTTTQQINNLDKEVDKVNQNLVVANKDLKNIVQQYKKPARCCLDITLLITLIGMIVGIIKFAKG